ncbi:MAG: tRNA (adenosine(37)-N6)-threonylcarbamoyltransferase complex dimerization subunit type 1 TsaB [Lachnospiraceae bacterium]|nr:tRNA (adenosine(37)-N6)-threonylcarbamoyltransferase complex dimerization subunit type 1 TsaB [Lachnospiraceae bacterium]
MSNILAIESSGLTASVAVMSNGRLAAEYTVNNKKTHSRTLLPMINEVMKALELEPGELNCIAISCGPGSFTGLRIGSATAKGLGLALDKPIAEVSTLKGLAYNLCGNEGCVICPIMDARRQEVYTGAYEFVRIETNENRENSKKDSVSSFEMKTLITERAVPLTDMLSELEKLGKKVIFNGDAVPVYKDIIAEKFSLEYSFATETLLLQRAASIAALGEKIFLSGEAKDADVHTPVYLRKSQAERELEEGRT